MSARRYVSDDVAEWKLSMVATWPVPAFWPHARGGQHDGDLDPTAGIKAAELLIAELQRARSRKDKARIASRLLTEELEQIDARILAAKNSEPTSLPDLTICLSRPGISKGRRSPTCSTLPPGRPSRTP